MRKNKLQWKQDINRNYQLDVFKLLFSVLVFISHTDKFIRDDTLFVTKPYVYNMGWVSVHFFFVVSGFLMIKSMEKRNSGVQNAGRYAFDFVIGKFKRLAIPYGVATITVMCMYIVYNAWLGTSIKIFDQIVRVIPELFGVFMAGVDIQYNGSVWYISSMLLVMLPLCYLLIKKKDAYLYIYSPMIALFTFGFIYQDISSEYSAFIYPHHWYGVCLGGVIRAVCGVSFGSCAWIIYKKISEITETKRNKCLITLIEIITNIIFFYALLFRHSEKETLFSIMLLLPIMVAIPFTKKSYLALLFRFQWLKYFGSLSFSIYINHGAACMIGYALFSKIGYIQCVLYTMALTIVFCCINFFATKVIEKLIDKFKKYK